MVEVNSTESTVTMGLVVDSVSEVLNIRAEEIQETPSFGAQVDTEYILGMAKMDGKVKILLDIDKVLSVDQLQKMKDLA